MVLVEITPPSPPEVRVRYRWAYADALYEYRKDRGIHRALEEAIEVWKSLAWELPHQGVPLDWTTSLPAADLGIALRSDASPSSQPRWTALRSADQ
jgi:hypothetical protein